MGSEMSGRLPNVSVMTGRHCPVIGIIAVPRQTVVTWCTSATTPFSQARKLPAWPVRRAESVTLIPVQETV